MDCQSFLVTSTESAEFTHLTRELTRSTVIGLDAEWKPIRGHASAFPTVALLQLACQFAPVLIDDFDESVVFLLDLTSIHLPSLWELLKDVFVSPDILKLGFGFKQDLVYLSSTFCAQGCEPGFNKVEPYLDISSIYNHLQHKKSKDTKSLATICKEVLGISLSKELQCSDWSHRPLTEEQKEYAATDAHCLLQIFAVFQSKTVSQEGAYSVINGFSSPGVTAGLKEFLEKPNLGDGRIITKFCNALDMVCATTSSKHYKRLANVGYRALSRKTMPMDESLLKVVRKYSDKILLKDSDKMLKSSKRKGKRRSLKVAVGNTVDWQGPPPWDLTMGGDGSPKFLCDIMVEGLAKHLRCVGVDAAIPLLRKPESRELIDQAYKEKRVLLTRDAKLLRHQYLINNQIYRVKSNSKDEQLLEIMKMFKLKIGEGQLLSRCTKCNGRFIQKALTVEEAVEAAKGFQKIPNCLFDKNLEFWKCMDCNQIYWQGTQYHNALQRFNDICKLNNVS